MQLCLMDEITGIEGDAVAANQAKRLPDKVEFRCGCIDDGFGIQSYLIEDYRDLVEEGNIQIPLNLLDDFADSSALVFGVLNIEV